MKKFFILITIAVLACASYGQTQNISNINVIGMENIGFQNSIDLDNHGQIHADGVLPILTYSRNSVEWLQLGLYTDFANRIGGKIDVDLVPVNTWLDSKIGTNGNIQLPILSTIITNYVEFKVGLGAGYNFSDTNHGVEEIVSVTILQAKFSTSGVKK